MCECRDSALRRRARFELKKRIKVRVEVVVVPRDPRRDFNILRLIAKYRPQVAALVEAGQ